MKNMLVLAEHASKRKFTVDQPVLLRMYGAGEKWQRGIVVAVEGPSAYRIKTEDGELHRRHSDQLLSRTVSAQQSTCQSRPSWDQPDKEAEDVSEPEIQIPDVDLWPEIIGIPDNPVED